MSMEIIHRYFPDLSTEQRDRFAALGSLYAEWNERVNLISRKDIVHLYERHILHSLGIANVIHESEHFNALESVSCIDVGTGGGFPGVPLAIMFPTWRFHLIDSIGKKIIAVQGVVEGLGLTNATAEQVRSTDHRGRYDLIVSRAVTTLPEFIRDTKHLVEKGAGQMLYLKGGELADEIMPVRNSVRVHKLSDYFTEEFFATKKVVEVAM